jgi:hypothetical protein
MIKLTSIKRKSKSTVLGINVHGISLELRVPNTVVDTVTKESKEAVSSIKDSLGTLFASAVTTYHQHQAAAEQSTKKEQSTEKQH